MTAKEFKPVKLSDIRIEDVFKSPVIKKAKKERYFSDLKEARESKQSISKTETKPKSKERKKAHRDKSTSDNDIIPSEKQRTQSRQKMPKVFVRLSEDNSSARRDKTPSPKPSPRPTTSSNLSHQKTKTP